MPSLSIIVPVYNALPYLRSALESLKGQRFTDIEVLCVNDGSTDGSQEVMEEFAASDGRFRVIEKPNGGYGSAVNVGLDQAAGEYVGILEPDDWVEPDMFLRLWQARQRSGKPAADVVKCGWADEYPSGTSVATTLMSLYPRPQEGRIDSLVELLRYHPSVWSCIYRRDFLQQCGIRMEEAPGAGWVDNPFFYETLCAANKIQWIPWVGYHYRHHGLQSSAPARLDYRIPFDRLDDCWEIVDRLDASDQVRQMLALRSFNYATSMMNTLDFTDCLDRGADFWQRLRLLYRTLDRDMVLQSSRISFERKRYFMQVRGEVMLDGGAGRSKAKGDARPVVAVVPVRNHSRYLYEFVDALFKGGCSKIIFVDCGSWDLSRDFIAAMKGQGLVVQWVSKQEREAFRGLGHQEGGGCLFDSGSAETLAVVIDPTARVKPGFTRSVDKAARECELPFVIADDRIIAGEVPADSLTPTCYRPNLSLVVALLPQALSMVFKEGSAVLDGREKGIRWHAGGVLGMDPIKRSRYARSLEASEVPASGQKTDASPLWRRAAKKLANVWIASQLKKGRLA